LEFFCLASKNGRVSGSNAAVSWMDGLEDSAFASYLVAQEILEPHPLTRGLMCSSDKSVFLKRAKPDLKHSLSASIGLHIKEKRSPLSPSVR